MKFIMEVTDLLSMFSSMSPIVGVHVRAGGRTGQGARAEQFNLTGVPSSTSSLDGFRAGLGSESEEVRQRGIGSRYQEMQVHIKG